MPYPIEKTWFYNFALTKEQQEMLLEDYIMYAKNKCSYGSECDFCKISIAMVDYIVELENRLNNGN